MPNEDVDDNRNDQKKDKEVTLEDIKTSAQETMSLNDPSGPKIDPLSNAEPERGRNEPDEMDIDSQKEEKMTVNTSQDVKSNDLSDIDLPPAINEEKEKVGSNSILEPVGTSRIGNVGEGSSRRSKKRIYMIGVLVTVIIVGATGGVLFFRMRQAQENIAPPKQEEVMPTPTPEEEPGGVVVVDPDEPEEEPEEGQMSRSEISLEVLNATDISGHAGSNADTFEALGYEITEIGNASEDTSVNLLYVNPDVEDKVDVLLKDVEEELGITEVAGPLSNSDASARIVLGEE